jgi:hypothetical protein
MFENFTTSHIIEVSQHEYADDELLDEERLVRYTPLKPGATLRWAEFGSLALRKHRV